MLERLIGSTYSALDRDPYGQIVLRVQHPDGFAWSVAGRVLSASTEAGQPLLVFGLRDKTLAELQAALLAAGCTIVYANPDFQHLAADTLLDGAGKQSASDGDALRSYDSDLWALLDAYAVALEDLDADVESALRQLYLGTAEDEWLDVWGEYFGLPREDGEQDALYRVRIIVETLRPRVNRFAIEKAVFDFTGKRITIYEPWQDLFLLSEASGLSGQHRLQDGDFYTYNVVQPQSDVPIDWTKPLAVVDRNRAAGTIVKSPGFTPGVRFASFYGATDLPQPLFGLSSVLSNVVPSIDPTALGYLCLSEYEEIVNYKCNLFTINSFSNTHGANVLNHIGPAQYYVKASVCLSEDAELGSLNCIFGSYHRIDEAGLNMLSGDSEHDAYTLSVNVDGPSWESFEEVIDAVRVSSVQSLFMGTASGMRNDSYPAFGRRNTNSGWSGGWDDRIWNINRIYSGMNPISTNIGPLSGIS